MHGPYPGELRVRVIRFVEGGGSRREAAEQFDVSVSSAIRWVQRFRDDGTCEPIPRGGSTSPLEKHSQRILVHQDGAPVSIVRAPRPEGGGAAGAGLPADEHDL
jgi:transposase